MSPALPLLLLATVLGMVPRLRTVRLAWIVCSLTGCLVVLPALLRPSGILSPAATLGAVAPWQGAVDPESGNPAMRDVTFQIQPWLLFARHELRRGRLPLWNPHQSAGTPFWSNGQGAPLFPLHLVFAALPLSLGFVILPWLRVVISASGTWLLARELGLARPGALLAAVSFALSGMLVSFLLYPMGNALALVPWVLAMVERVAAGRSSWPPLALVSGLQLLAGHPETCLHTALVAALYVVARGGMRRPLVLGNLLLGWTVGAGLAAIQILPFALEITQSSRWVRWDLLPRAQTDLSLLLTQPLRLLFPDLYGNPAAGTWWGPFNYLATAAYVGILTLPLAAIGLGRLRRDRRWLALALVLVAAFAAAYHLPGVRDLLEAVPLIGRALHHRLIFAVELVLALAAGAGLEAWLGGRAGRSLLAGCVAVAAGGLAVVWGFYDDWAAHALAGSQLLRYAWILLACALLGTSLLLPLAWRRRLWPLLAGLAVLDLWAAHGSLNPPLELENLYPETGSVRFLVGRPGRVAGLGHALHPNAATVYGLFDVRGDDPVKLERYERFNEALGGSHPTYFEPLRNWSSPWLDRLAVGWVVGGPAEGPPASDWEEVYRGEDATVWQRPTALPLVRWAHGSTDGELRIEDREPGHWRLWWASPKPARLVVAEVRARGWHARSNGHRLPVTIEDDALLAVDLGPGEGELELSYRPPGLVTGSITSLAALALLLWQLLRRRALRSRPAPGAPAPNGRRAPR